MVQKRRHGVVGQKVVRPKNAILLFVEALSSITKNAYICCT